MKIIKHNSVEEALAFFTEIDEPHSFQAHSLNKGDKIKSDTHKNLNEWIVIFNGQCIINAGRKKEVVTGDWLKSFVVHIPKNTKHSITALSNIAYFVIRDGKINKEDVL